MNDMKQKSLKLHALHPGKIKVESTVELSNQTDLSLAYSPYVAEPCKEIYKDKAKVYDYTSKSNMVAVISDGTAVLGLGDIGPDAALPVMEGKAVLFKEFAGVDAFPIVLNTKDPSEIIDIISALAPSFGGINLEDIAAPKCFIIEKELKKRLDIPVFHDDQHGTSIITLAALINACRLTKKEMKNLNVVICGLGAAGSNIARLFHKMGIEHIYGYSLDGVINKDKINDYDFSIKELLNENVLKSSSAKSLEELIQNKDVFVGVSAKGLMTKKMVKSMSKDPFIFAMANPDPEINYETAKEAGAKVVGTGRSDYPNQINNVLAFPGIFKGALKARAKNITETMKIASAIAISEIIQDNELKEDYIIPSPFDKRVVESVSKAVFQEAIKTKE